MNSKIKYMLSVIGEHLLGILISLAIICVAGAVFGSQVWLASVLTAIVYLSSMYSKAWRNSGRDMRAAKALLKSGEADSLNYRIYDGFIHALPLLIISAVLYVLTLIFDGLFITVFRIYNFAFLFLFEEIKPTAVIDVLTIILPYLCYGIGYIVGKSRKTFIVQHIGKLIYKKKKNGSKTK